ncbi:alpha/beta hydrolase [Amycolatopsis sp. PS_44_ISF1]|uniref:alpha/beta hydrolase n=1 Tax=Amycolatopsis sp. PS_44_ISF1 TaxID=2974917 RepID=UPI0028DE6B27|nr:alpha/beta hydrolase [Amycolatopsis sp. PS_44_ISF1]MDT8915285.1 alpha/beta hydrolase [Amycolatopsis sp. PS_44_ISF1]
MTRALPPTAPPEPETADGVVLYRDAEVAPRPGYRPLRLDLAVPAGAPPDPGWPVVAFVPGGAFASAEPAPLGRYLGERLPEAGFAVATVHFRHSRGAVYPAQLHDVKAAVRWLRHHAGALALDPGRFGAWGHAAGGYLAVMLAVTGDRPDLEGDLGVTGPSSAVQAAVAWSPPSDFARLPPPTPGSPWHRTGQDPRTWLLGASPAEHPALAAAASPLTHVTASAAPMLIAHGTGDNGIPIAQSEALISACWQVGADAEFAWLPDTGHRYGHRTRAAMTTAGIEFLRRRLGH